MGALAFAQVSKTDTINKTASRKVLNNDMKNVPPDTESEAQSDKIKGSFHQKMKSEQNTYIKISDESARVIKGSVTQKGRINNALTPDESITQKGREGKVSTTEKQNYTIKTSSSNKTPVDIVKKGNENDEATTQKKHVSNIKWTTGKVALDTISTPDSGKSEIFMKITDVKGEK